MAGVTVFNGWPLIGRLILKLVLLEYDSYCSDTMRIGAYQGALIINPLCVLAFNTYNE